MGLLSYTQLCKLIDDGVIENSCYENVNSASIDLVLGEKILVEKHGYRVIDMLKKNSHHFDEYTMGENGFVVEPGQFILAHTKEVFNLPSNISSEYKLKSTMARNGYSHLLAGWCDSGWSGSVLTLEFHNVNQHTAIHIKPGMKCGQMIFFEHESVPEDRSYKSRGSYNGDKSVSAGKGLK